MDGRKPTKPPGLKVMGDAFVVVEDGVEYHPHAGEWVQYRGQPSIADIIRMAYLDEARAKQAETGADIEALYAAVLEETLVSVIAWTWTDDQGERYPSPPTADVLRRLTLAELTYLLGRGRVAETEEAVKNAASPSTSR